MTQYPKRRAYGFQLLAAVGLRHSSWVDFSITQIWKIVQLLYKCPAPGNPLEVSTGSCYTMLSAVRFYG